MRARDVVCDGEAHVGTGARFAPVVMGHDLFIPPITSPASHVHMRSIFFQMLLGPSEDCRRIECIDSRFSPSHGQRHADRIERGRAKFYLGHYNELPVRRQSGVASTADKSVTLQSPAPFETGRSRDRSNAIVITTLVAATVGDLGRLSGLCFSHLPPLAGSKWGRRGRTRG